MPAYLTVLTLAANTHFFVKNESRKRRMVDLRKHIAPWAGGLCLVAACVSTVAAPLQESVRATSAETRDPRLVKAQQLLQRGEAAKARRLLEAILATSPESVPAHLLSGAVFLQEDPGRAEKHAYEVLRLEPRNDKGLVLLGRSFAARRRGTDSEAEAALWQAEIEAYGKLARQEPDWPVPLFRRALAHMAVQQLFPEREGELKKAAADLKRVVAAVEGDSGAGLEAAQVHFQLGLVYKRHARHLLVAKKVGQAEARYELALDHFRRSLDEDPGRIEVLAESVGLHRRLKQPEKGHRMIEAALEATANERRQGQLYELAGSLHRHAGKTEEALTAYRRALELNPDLRAASLALARLHFAREEWDEAAGVLQGSIEANPGFLRGYLGLGELYVSQEQPRRALRHLEAGLAVPPADAEVMGRGVNGRLARQRIYDQMALRAGWLYLEETKDLEQARAMLARIQGSAHFASEAVDLEGWILYHAAEYERALEVLQQAEEKPMNHYHLAAVHFKRSEMELAGKHIATALEKEGDFHGREAAEALRRQIEAAGP